MSNPRGGRGSRRGGRGRGGIASASLPPPPQTRVPPQHRTFQPGKRYMELMPSVSRSSGLDKDGDALRDPKVQEEYRAFIQTKVDDYWAKYPLGAVPGSGDPDPEAARHKKETEGNLLILFRKLREGLMSTQRRDAFALEVYETSLHLSVLFRSPAQTTSTLSHLFPAFYVSPAQSTPPTSYPRSTTHIPDTGAGVPSSSPLPPTALASTLIFLLHHLVASYPSQLSFHTQLRQLHPELQHLLRAPTTTLPTSGPGTPSSTPQTEPASQPADRPRRLDPDSSSTPYGWLAALARCLRRRDYARLASLARRTTFVRFVAGDGRQPNLAKEAIQVLVNDAVEKARGPTWNVLRTAYRDVNLRATPTGASEGDTTGAWLARSLVLCSGSCGEKVDGSASHDSVTTWLEERSAKGEARRKEGEGMEGRWILVKA